MLSLRLTYAHRHNSTTLFNGLNSVTRCISILDIILWHLNFSSHFHYHFFLALSFHAMPVHPFYFINMCWYTVHGFGLVLSVIIQNTMIVFFMCCCWEFLITSAHSLFFFSFISGIIVVIGFCHFFSILPFRFFFFVGLCLSLLLCKFHFRK